MDTKHNLEGPSTKYMISRTYTHTRKMQSSSRHTNYLELLENNNKKKVQDNSTHAKYESQCSWIIYTSNRLDHFITRSKVRAHYLHNTILSRQA